MADRNIKIQHTRIISVSQGPAGPVGMVWHGAYDNAHAYAVNDGVSYLGSSYICILASTGNLPTNGTYWSQIAAKGDTGATGSTGATGATGSQGPAGADGIGTAASVGALVNTLTEKTTPVDADMLGLMDSEDTNLWKKFSWANIKATLKTYFDTLYNLYVHPNHSGDVTSVADGATTIANEAVTYAKMQHVSATAKVLGRVSAGAGDVEEIAIDTDLTSVSASDDTVPSAKATKTYADTKATKNSVQALGTKNTDYTCDFNSGLFATVTTGSGNAIITIPDWASATESVSAWLYITQGATARTQTLGTASGTNNNIISSGGLMSAGDALLNSGANTVDAYNFVWNGTKWFIANALFDIKA